jgi:RNAse (barnase) inhibitor barstar
MSDQPTVDSPRSDGPVHVGPLGDPAVAALCVLARSLGFQCRRIDLAGCTSKGELIARIGRALEFPSWFGQNWDALFDCLTDLSWAPAPGYVLIFERAGELGQIAPDVLDTTVAVLRDAAEAWRARGVPFRAFVSAPAG